MSARYYGTKFYGLTIAPNDLMIASMFLSEHFQSPSLKHIRWAFAVLAWGTGMGILIFVDTPSHVELIVAGLCVFSAAFVRPWETEKSADKPPSIQWSDRDIGEKFSIVMFFIVAALITAFPIWLAYS